MSSEPLIRLEPDGKAPLLSYDIPEPSIYFGTNFIEVEYGSRYFIEKARKKPAEEMRLPMEEIHESFDKEELVDKVQESIDSNFADSPMFPNARPTSGRALKREHHTTRARRSPSAEATGTDKATGTEQEAAHEQMMAQEEAETEGDERARSRARTRKRDHRKESRDTVSREAREIAEMMRAGKRLNIYRSLYGEPKYNYIADPQRAEPVLLLVETYRLASYLGSYGAGRIVKTFTLLPGERTKISIRTFRKSKRTRQESSSILDSFSQESASEFEETIASEQSDRQKYDKSFQYHAEAEAKASWGWGSASVKGGVKGATNSAREEFSKNTSNATNKHAQKASSKREVEVNTNYEERETIEREKSIERELENINVGRTLNYVFRQMNQEFVTILSLVDVRVAFFNGFPETKKEVALHELDRLLEEYIVSEKRKDVRQDIRNSLGNIVDYQGKLHNDFIEERSVGDDSYLRVRKEKTSTYIDPASETEIEVPGIVLSATKNVLRTEGVMVEALIGSGEAVDRYSGRLQELEVERREAEVNKEKAKAEQASLASEAIRKNDRDRTDLLKNLWPENTANPPLEVTVQHKNTDNGREQKK